MKFKKGDIAIQINCPKNMQFVYITGIDFETTDKPSYFHKHYNLGGAGVENILYAPGTVKEALLRKPTEEELMELKLMVAL